MKKNKTMRAASGLLIATLLSTSVVSGTYAKYVTSDSGQDQARVAKFGVVASVSGELFGDSYSATTGNSIQAWAIDNPTVSAKTQKEKIVAPGTKNNTGMTFSVTGTPEVSTQLIFGVAKDADGKEYVNTDIELKSGSYGVMVEYSGVVTSSNVTDFYTLDGTTYKKAENYVDGTTYYELKDVATGADGYKPVKWKVGTTPCDTVSDVMEELQTIYTSKSAVPNEDLSTEYGSNTITWEWAFETGNQNNVTKLYSNDYYDTILGDMIAAQGGATDYDVVCLKGTDYETVNYASVSAANNSANKVIVAYTGATAPATAAAADCAVLTESFGANLSVVQVD